MGLAEWLGLRETVQYRGEVSCCTAEQCGRVGSAACLVVSGGMTVSARQPSEYQHGSDPSLLLSGDGIRTRGRRASLPGHGGRPPGQEAEGGER